MKFSTGQVVVHPHHGPATITAISTRVVRGTSEQYLMIEVHDSNLMVGVPLCAVDEIGLRPVLDSDAVAEMFDVLAAPSSAQDSTWSRRMKANAERLRTGDVRTVAGLIRDLTRRQTDKSLSLGEKDLLRDARRLAVSEMALALSMSQDEADIALDAAIRSGTQATRPDVAVAVAG